MWWKTYFWIYAVLSILGSIFLLPQLPSFNFASWEGLFESVLLIIGAYSFIYKKRNIPTSIWKPIFILIIAVWIAQIIYYSSIIEALKPALKFLENSPSQSFGAVVLSMILSIPALYGIYKLGFTSFKKK